MPPRNLTIIFFTALLSTACYFKAERNRYAQSIANAMHEVSLHYVEPVEERELFENAMSGMLSGLDQYSEFISPDDFKEMNASLDQEFGGIGVEVEKKLPEDPITILTPLFDSPAYRAGLLAGDRILSVNGESLIGVHLTDSVKLMRGEPGSEARLRIARLGLEQPLEVTVRREVISVDSVLGDTRRADGSWDFHLEENPRIAYFRLTTFGQRTAAELEQALTTIAGQKFEALILDVRGNAGGLLDAAVETCDLFLDSGRIVSTNGRDGELRDDYSATSSLVVPKDLPMAVLVNNYSASASEIVAACLQDHGRAVVVGERTWGKGTVQNILPLEGGQSALKLTTATYWRPSGKNIHRSERAKGSGKEKDDDAWGVQPDEGFEAAIPEELLEPVFLRRRERDRFHEPTAAATEVEDEGNNDASGAIIEKPAADDPQVRRAVDYLKQRLLEIDAASGSA